MVHRTSEDVFLTDFVIWVSLVSLAPLEGLLYGSHLMIVISKLFEPNKKE